MPFSSADTVQATETIIVCEDVHKWYGDFHVLKGITTTIRRGEVVVVCGPSGSGKSTFIRTINRLEEHQRGRIIVDGIELTHDLRNIDAIRREVGMVFQQFNFVSPSDSAAQCDLRAYPCQEDQQSRRHGTGPRTPRSSRDPGASSQVPWAAFGGTTAAGGNC